MCLMVIIWTLLHAQLLGEDAPGKVGGPPGDAFDVVYTVVADTVREKMHNVDPVLAEYIRCEAASTHASASTTVVRLH